MASAALERFLARCPALQQQRVLLSLAQKGEELKDEELVDMFAELLLHPSYTVPLFGCIRPLIPRILKKTVNLLWVVSHFLKSDVNYDDGPPSLAEDDIYVIKFYSVAGCGLRLHEIACLAFCRILDLAPVLLRFILNYFSYAPPPFYRLSKLQEEKRISCSKLPGKVVLDILNLVRVSFRFLQRDCTIFSKKWDWTPFLGVADSFENVDGYDQTLLDKVLDIRWCCKQILSMVMRISDRAAFFGFVPEEALLCYGRWLEFCQDVAIEKAGFFIEPANSKVVDPSRKDVFKQDNFLKVCWGSALFDQSGSSSKDEGILGEHAPKKVARGMISAMDHFVLTSSLQEVYETVLVAVSQKWPVVMQGPVGSGKTMLINKLAEEAGKKVLSLHMNEQLDSKVLMGSYICTHHPGEFKWQPGCLAQALSSGLWVVLEDIDEAPSEIYSLILPLLEGTTACVVGDGRTLTVAEDFRLFATSSNVKHDRSCSSGKIMHNNLWRKIMLRNPTEKDLLEIVNTCFPTLVSVSQKFVDTLRRVNTVSSLSVGYLESRELDSVNGCMKFSVRDLLKWCKRVVDCGLDCSVPISALSCKRISQEAADVFVASSASYDDRLLLMKEIVIVWGEQAIQNMSKPIVQNLQNGVQVGRVTLKCSPPVADLLQRSTFVGVSSSLHTLERIASSVKYNEPVLLVGETGIGKTMLVQILAARLGHPLTVLNMSQQSDISDLIGGFKPANASFLCLPLYEEFKDIFCKSYSRKVNEEILSRVARCVSQGKWKELLNHFQTVINMHRIRHCESGHSLEGAKRKRPLAENILQQWESFSKRVNAAISQLSSSVMPFSFVEGAFVSALRNGDWILLDEINLAPHETLQRISEVLDCDSGTLCLTEKGDMDYIARHPNFRLFACMNPATDVGKKDLPHLLRNRFSNYYVDDVLSSEDLTLFVSQYLDGVISDSAIVHRIVAFYKKVRNECTKRFQDGANQRPHFSLRSLARALSYVSKARSKFGPDRAIYDGFCMFFVTSLDASSSKLMNKWIVQDILNDKNPDAFSLNDYIKLNPNAMEVPKNYVRTDSIEKNLQIIARTVFARKYPILLQGPTSSGKTSLVRYLAAITGHKFIRINNHEHTDLQEYFGTYVPDSHGKLSFQEGVLVKAIRNGYWIVLDELNLAPSDVLEALNRLLDDNRELFVPELLETIPAHPDFVLFATQNPPNSYAGRKMLSRAFRNRFVEIHVDELPINELISIVSKSSEIPESRAHKMVQVMSDLQSLRQNDNVFAGKYGPMTLRDLFRWANRFREFGCSYEDLAREGFYLLGERLRDQSAKCVIQEAFMKHKLIKSAAVVDRYSIPAEDFGRSKFYNIIWTKSMQRLYFLVRQCYKLREPVLLVGDTGGGKTTVCQLLSDVLQLNLRILNCHQHSETSDFIGSFIPVRDRSKLVADFRANVEKLMMSKIFKQISGKMIISLDIVHASSCIDSLSTILNCAKRSDGLQSDIDDFEQVLGNLIELKKNWDKIFEWQDGPLIKAMKNGDLFLVDEISLAGDSVLERLNSVLEPERQLTLAEKGGSVPEKIIAHPNFFLLATMNPGGDYGKKELSRALQNRFTQIWVPPVSDIDELRSIALGSLGNSDVEYLVDCMLSFWEWFNLLQTGRTMTVRDLLAWVTFINATKDNLGCERAFMHGAFLVLLDGLSLGSNLCGKEARLLRDQCTSFLVNQLKVRGVCDESHSLKTEDYGWNSSELSANPSINTESMDQLFGVHPFYISKGETSSKQGEFKLLAPTTHRNALRVLRALQLRKPVLLEGSPGVGKTSLVIALAELSGHSVARINLSEETEMMDLLGSDLPVDNERQGLDFAWSDGILLQAIKNGSWVLLDELNLAPQSVLEGLNAILDHRSEVFIPELGCTFKCHPYFRIFACQNPFSQGGGRKGLPKSFLNRFTKVYIDELAEEDYHFICVSLFPSIPRPILEKLIYFNKRLFEDTMLFHRYGQNGCPWEFNLRDVIRSCQMIENAPEMFKMDCFLCPMYIQRMRTVDDRRRVLQLYVEIFGRNPFINLYPQVHVLPHCLTLGIAVCERNHVIPTTILNTELYLLPGMQHILEAVLNSVRQRWPCILVGPSASGKTSIVRVLAHLTGNTLHELHLSSGTDVSELLGCFEQFSALRHLRELIVLLEGSIRRFCSFSSGHTSNGFANNEMNNLVVGWLMRLLQLSGISCALNFDSTMSDRDSKSIRWAANKLVEIVRQLKYDIAKYGIPLLSSSVDIEKCLRIASMAQERECVSQAKFEWVPGGLIRAIEHGEWVLLENANLCNPSILDRINSLLEPGGSISVNECGLVNGSPLVLQAHPNFRLFLTVDPKHGEISRAMRNRGLEVYVMPPSWMLDGLECGNVEEEVKRFLILSGMPIKNFVDLMTDTHMYARKVGLQQGIPITLVELNCWIQLLNHLLRAGEVPTKALISSCKHIYSSSFYETDGQVIVDHLKDSLLPLVSSSANPIHVSSLCFTGGWPNPLTIRDFLWYPTEASVRWIFLHFELLTAQYAGHIASLSEKRHVPICQPSFAASGNIPSFWKQLSTLWSNHPMSIPHCDENLSVLTRSLFIAANWTMEQAGHDWMLYLTWIKCCVSKLDSSCSFWRIYSVNFVDHPIWSSALIYWEEIVATQGIDVKKRHVPILSPSLAESAMLHPGTAVTGRSLSNAILSFELLHVCLMQWCIEDDLTNKGSVSVFPIAPILKHLRDVETVLFRAILLPAYSNSFNDLHERCQSFVDHHRMFWNAFSSSTRELVVYWHRLRNKAVKLQAGFPDVYHAVDLLLSEALPSEAATCGSSLCKPLLWTYGGHPIMSTSASVFFKLQALMKLCTETWPQTDVLINALSCESQDMPHIALCANGDVKFATLEDICVALLIVNERDKNGSDVLQQLEDIFQVLQNTLDSARSHIKHTLESKGTFLGDEVSCCKFIPDIFCSNVVGNCWLETLPIADRRSLLMDMWLLHDLSESSLMELEEELYMSLVRERNLLKDTLQFSLDFASRKPLDFVPHQMLLWLLDSWESVNSVGVEIRNLYSEMLFKWHSSLWHDSHSFYMLQNHSEYESNVDVVPLLFCPAITICFDRILDSSDHIKDHLFHSLKLRVTSLCIWEGDAPVNLLSLLSLLARSQLKKIIFAHKKSFGIQTFQQIMSAFVSIGQNTFKPEDLHSLLLLMQSSNHKHLVTLSKPCIKPLLKELYFGSQHDDVLTLGRSWIRIGELRFSLLMHPDSLDPVLIYTAKYETLCEKISLLRQEIKVRQDCEQVAGRRSEREDQKGKMLDDLEQKRLRLKRKLPFCPNNISYDALKHTCVDFWNEFMQLVNLFLSLVKKKSNTEQLVGHARNCQIISSSFIKSLSEEYASYDYMIQPIQIAIFEVKLGLSLAFSSVFLQNFAEEMGCSTCQLNDTLLPLLRFPVQLDVNPLLVLDDSLQPKLLSCDGYASEQESKMDLLSTLLTFAYKSSREKMVTKMETRAYVLELVADRLSYHLHSSFLMDRNSFLVLRQIFGEVASLWMDMRDRERRKQGQDSAFYKFRPQEFRIASVLDVDVSLLGSFASSGSLPMEWQEVFNECSAKPQTDDENLEQEWRVVDSVLERIACTYSKLFGSNKLFNTSWKFVLTDDARVHHFSSTYEMCSKIIKGVPLMFSSSLDASFLPEHLLRVSVEYHRKFGSNLPNKHYNFYKDANTSVLVEMVKPLQMLREHVIFLLNNLQYRPDAEKILHVIEVLLSLQPNTPLGKALLSLQFLVSSMLSLQESGIKFPVSDELISIVHSWQRLEMSSWPALLDGILEQFRHNAEKLWFPTYSLLHQTLSCDGCSLRQSTLESMEEFIQTSNVGEFSWRLELLLMFHNQVDMDLHLERESSYSKDNLMILYNIFGYYVQFLPLISAHIKVCRNQIEKELQELSKLISWKSSFSFSANTHKKLSKLIQKFKDELQKPISIFLNVEEIQKQIIEDFAVLETELVEISRDSSTILLESENKAEHPGDMKRKDLLHDWHHNFEAAFSSFCSEDMVDIMKPFMKKSIDLVDKEAIFPGYVLLQRICSSAADYIQYWKTRSKNQRKSETVRFMKYLEESGLCAHQMQKSNENPSEANYFLQPSYNIEHLLAKWLLESNDSLCLHLRKFARNSDQMLHVANSYYFRNIFMLQQMKLVRINFHRDLMIEQVDRLTSFIEHLVEMQQDQRSVVYTISHHLNVLGSYKKAIASCTKSSIAVNQHAALTCMWRQKQVIDGFCSMLSDAILYLEVIEHTHLNICRSFRDEVHGFLSMIKKFHGMFLNSKDVLDQHLLGKPGTLSPLEYKLLLLLEKDVHLLGDNFQIIHDFEEVFQASSQNQIKSVGDSLLCRFADLIMKSKHIEEMYYLETANESGMHEGDVSPVHVQAALFVEVVHKAANEIVHSLQFSRECVYDAYPKDFIEDVASWSCFYQCFAKSFNLPTICDLVQNVILSASKLVNSGGSRQPELCSLIENMLKDFCILLDLLVTFGHDVLKEFVIVHEKVSEMTFMLANMFTFLQLKGFGSSESEELGDGKIGGASGTGMGEGAGGFDVSDQIEVEDQLIGASEKGRNEKNSSEDLSQKQEKGIEMSTDFDGETFDDSENSESSDDNENDGDPDVESIMGEVPDNNRVMKEKLSSKDDGKKSCDNGSSVTDSGSGFKELGAKHDNADDAENLSLDDEIRMDEDNEESHDVNTGDGDFNDMDINEEPEAFNCSSGDNRQKQELENDMNMDVETDKVEQEELENEATENLDNVAVDEKSKEGDNPDTVDKDGVPTDEEMEDGNVVEDSKLMEAAAEKPDNVSEDGSKKGTDKLSDDTGAQVETEGYIEDEGLDSVKESNEGVDSGNMQDPVGSVAVSIKSLPQGGSRGVELVHLMDGRKDPHGGLNPLYGADSNGGHGGEILTSASANNEITETSQGQGPSSVQTMSLQRLRTNPYLSPGDALKELKTKARILPPTTEQEQELPNDVEDLEGHGYRYVSGSEMGTSQALGPAMSGQVNEVASGVETTERNPLEEVEEDYSCGRELEGVKLHQLKKCASASLGQNSVLDASCPPAEEGIEASNLVNSHGEDLVVVTDSPLIKEVSVTPDALAAQREVIEPDSIWEKSFEGINAAVWRKYECETSVLSQELAEKLRIILEPTLASKLQGDYRTGKRINMKKVIPYIASHYRKDKIWLRRSRPSKRNYQVLVAIDDSLSMSEGSCDEFARKAVVTVCRAMSQIEIGQLALVSFGRIGNIQLLHDFNEPFTAETGLKLVSSLEFRQEDKHSNVEHTPMVDLLRFLNNKLGSVAASVPSGRYLLQQLVLIIGDGKFFENLDNIRASVRDALSNGRLIAFVILNGSIVNYPVFSFGTSCVASRYLDMFPFPYYVVIKDINTLPSILADMLRQWFELIVDARE